MNKYALLAVPAALALAALSLQPALAQHTHAEHAASKEAKTTDRHFIRMRPSIGPWKSPHPT